MPDTSCVNIDFSTTPSLARQRDSRYVWHPWVPAEADLSEITLARGAGYRVWDLEGREYIDAASLNSTCGYGHPDLVTAISNQVRRLHGTDLATACHLPAGALAERLASYLPDDLNRTLFVNSGSEGFEAAVFIAAAYWRLRGQSRSRIVSFAKGYHGSTLLTRSLSALPPIEHPITCSLRTCQVELPGSPRQLRAAEALPRLLGAFSEAIDADADDPPMAIVVEPLLNVGGAILLPEGFLAGLRKICDERDILLIIDEVFTGYGRTGKMFAFQFEDVVPDIVVSSKGLAGGYMPITAVTVRDQLHALFADDPILGGLRYGHTTSGHAVACAAALATLDIIEADNLLDRVTRLGRCLLDATEALLDHPNVVDVRGIGFVLAVEMTTAEMAVAVAERAYSNRLLVRQNGSVVLVCPPLIIDEQGLDEVQARLRAAVTG
jgi:adenosylmethionine-8-amino-7-oxononanoate aminotransferase